MRSYLFSILFFVLAIPLQKNGLKADSSPLADFSAEWNNPKYLVCNTAANTGYLSSAEKKLIYILNLLHADPALFARTVVTKYPDYRRKPLLKNIPEYQSLLDTLKKLKPIPLLRPDSLCYESAKCLAIYAGKTGYTGHERKTNECKLKKRHDGECCQYGYDDPLAIAMALVIDQGVPSLAHRYLCLSRYKGVGVSIQPHMEYGHNTVIDFYY